jgi:hypothetical protein
MVEVAAAIDRLERRIRAAHPEMRYVFLGAEALSQPARAASAPAGPGARAAAPGPGRSA